ncbi:MAG: hypothetical protein KIH89_003195 [Candidatus Shapirobacteria bacterium]|nr:hypothetical protein [Candidatus Shapirobacteria bacterium]
MTLAHIPSIKEWDWVGGGGDEQAQHPDVLEIESDCRCHGA